MNVTIRYRKLTIEIAVSAALLAIITHFIMAAN